MLREVACAGDHVDRWPRSDERMSGNRWRQFWERAYHTEQMLDSVRKAVIQTSDRGSSEVEKPSIHLNKDRSWTVEMMMCRDSKDRMRLHVLTDGRNFRRRNNHVDGKRKRKQKALSWSLI